MLMLLELLRVLLGMKLTSRPPPESPLTRDPVRVDPTHRTAVGGVRLRVQIKPKLAAATSLCPSLEEATACHSLSSGALVAVQVAAMLWPRRQARSPRARAVRCDVLRVRGAIPTTAHEALKLHPGKHGGAAPCL